MQYAELLPLNLLSDTIKSAITAEQDKIKLINNLLSGEFLNGKKMSADFEKKYEISSENILSNVEKIFDNNFKWKRS